MVGESHQDVFLTQIDTSGFAEFELSEFGYRDSTYYHFRVKMAALGGDCLLLHTAGFRRWRNN